MYELYNLLIKQGDTTPRYINVSDLLTVYDFTSSNVRTRIQIRKSETDDELIISIPGTFQAPNLILFPIPENLEYTHLISEIPQSLLKRKSATSFNKFEKLEIPIIPGNPNIWEFQIDNNGSIHTFITGGLVIIKDYNYAIN